MPRLPQVDILKGLAIIAVIVLHGLGAPERAAILSGFNIAQAVPVFILLMGFNARMSFEARGSGDSVAALYGAGYLSRRLLRLLGPVGVAAAVVVTVALIRGLPLSFGWKTLLMSMPVPLPGQYFIAVSLALVGLAPLMFAAFRRAPRVTVAITVALALGFEILANGSRLFAADYYLYQVSPLRFLPLFAVGMWLVDDTRIAARHNRFVIAWSVVSTVLLAAYAVGWRSPLIGVEFAYNVVFFGYPAALVALGLTWLPRGVPRQVAGLLAQLGLASYHIFLVQGVWFSAVGLQATTGWKWAGVSILVCCCVGWLWFRLGAWLNGRTGSARRRFDEMGLECR